MEDLRTGVELEPNLDEELVDSSEGELSDNTSNFTIATIDSAKLHNIDGNSSCRVSDDGSGDFKNLMADLGVVHRLFSCLGPYFDNESVYANNGTDHMKYPFPNTQYRPTIKILKSIPVKLDTRVE